MVTLGFTFTFVWPFRSRKSHAVLLMLPSSRSLVRPSLRRYASASAGRRGSQGKTSSGHEDGVFGTANLRERNLTTELCQQRTIFDETMPFVALRVSMTSCDCSTMAL